MIKVSDSVAKRGGPGLPGVVVSLLTYPGGAPVPLYSDDGITVQDTVETTDRDGNYEFYVNPGNYSIRYTYKGVIRKQIDDISIGDSELIADLSSLAAGKGAGLVGASQAVTYLPGTLGGRYNETVSVRDAPFLVLGTGLDETAGILAAIATGKNVFFPKPLVRYVCSQPIVPVDGQEIIMLGGGTLKLADGAASPTLWNLNGRTGVKIRTFTLDGNKDNVPTGTFISMTGSIDCELTDNRFVNMPGTSLGSIVLQTGAQRNRLLRNYSLNSEGTAIGLSGTNVRDNEVAFNELQGNGGFGIRLGETASNNLLAFNKTTQSTLELIGITYNCTKNRVIGNHAEGSLDAGISVTGSGNIVIGNECIRNGYAGIGVWGNDNTVSGNSCIDNGQVSSFHGGVMVYPAFGGTGQYNTITGNYCNDTQTVATQLFGVRLEAQSYTAWVTATVVAAAAYRFNGLNLYRTTAGGTTGASPPVHTSGSVSDGGVTWEYINTFRVAVECRYNDVIGNSIPRAPSGATSDAGAWAFNNRLHRSAIDYGEAATLRVNGPAISWTSINDVQIGNTTTNNHGIAITSSATGIGRIGFGDTALAGQVNYDHSTDTLSLGAGGAGGRISVTSTVTSLAALSNYANDAAAQAGGIPVNGLYRNGSVVQIRVV